MKKKLIGTLLITSILAGCASSKPNPIPLSQEGDAAKSCELLIDEMASTKTTIAAARHKRNAQIGQNLVAGSAGVFLLVPFFFMDLGDTASVEEKAAFDRHARLMSLARAKNCNVPADIADPQPEEQLLDDKKGTNSPK